jgi:hypothetical protein
MTESLVPELFDRPPYPSCSHRTSAPAGGAAPTPGLGGPRRNRHDPGTRRQRRGPGNARRGTPRVSDHAPGGGAGERRRDCRTWLNAAHRETRRGLRSFSRGRADAARQAHERVRHRAANVDASLPPVPRDGPGTYLRRRRLSAARQELPTAPPGSETVTGVAVPPGRLAPEPLCPRVPEHVRGVPSETLRRGW